MKEYPVIEGKYRFLGGWNNIPNSLKQLIVGRGYEIDLNGQDCIIRGSSKLIMIYRADFEKYFEPYIDYEAEPTNTTANESLDIESERIEVDKTISNCNTHHYINNSESEESLQMSLF
ncbi:hypothetical protein [Shouchella miscanthi]|uniref:Uncharacterized protein n=1 Tax=Shouchella miscanthi TaxID=2598861 RepID=A0ABU6NJS8_9BACI|nr:hypothetical protein [Shouchella miscanthi]